MNDRVVTGASSGEPANSETRRGSRTLLRVALAAAVAGVVLSATVAVGFAAAGNGSPTPTVTASTNDDDSSWGPPWRMGRGFGPSSLTGRNPGSLWDIRKVLHAEVVVQKEGGTQTVLIQRGVASDVSSSSITLKSSDGFTKTYHVTSQTRVNGDQGAADSIDNGSEVVVFAEQKGNGATATAVLDACD
jgi:hypothetical protein